MKTHHSSRWNHKLSTWALAAAVVMLLVCLEPTPAQAYLGPGAGFAFVGSFLALAATLFLSLFYLMTWPIRWIFLSIRSRHALKRARVKRVVIVGLDGQEPELTEKFMEEGILPNFSKLKEEGAYRRLSTSLLAESPVAWSCFQTGCNPGKHKIYDFLVPNRKVHLPELSSVQIRPPRRTLPLGPFQIPLSKPIIEAGRKSRPFWNILGEHGVFSSILRVPITFPPEKFRGVLLSAMCVPDLAGSQGSFFYFTSDPEDGKDISGGSRIMVSKNGSAVKGEIPGPENSMKKDGGLMKLPFEVRPGKNGSDFEMVFSRSEKHPLPLKKFTDYISISFRAMPGIKVRGLVRFYLIETEPHFKLYMTPVNIDPEKPALPISYPSTYSIYLAKTQGPFATLGLAEDTNALKSGILDEDAFLEMCWDIHAEREKMFFDALEKTRRGLVCCVFDITDRLQHMFFRYLDPNHPGNRTRDKDRHKNAIRDMYIKMDEMVGRIRKQLDEDTVLFVMSDHGFKGFKRGVNLNSWLHQNGYLALKHEKPTGEDYFSQVDWSRTRAYALGFGGIFLNMKNREARGTVQPGEEEARLKKEISEKLIQLRDDENGGIDCVKQIYDRDDVYTGPYVKDAPDLIVGFRVGYRTSVNNVTGGVTENIFEDNERDWSGDHNFNPPDVPGILFCNKKIETESPKLIDIGPTVLDLFGVPAPGYCDGGSFLPRETSGVKEEV